MLISNILCDCRATKVLSVSILITRVGREIQLCCCVPNITLSVFVCCSSILSVFWSPLFIYLFVSCVLFSTVQASCYTWIDIFRGFILIERAAHLPLVIMKFFMLRIFSFFYHSLVESRQWGWLASHMCQTIVWMWWLRARVAQIILTLSFWHHWKFQARGKFSFHMNP